MSTSAPQSLVEYFATLPDPRIDRAKRHELLDIVVIAFCAVLCGAEGWEDIATFGRAREAWFRRFLALPNGIPSHDTFGRVFARLDPVAFHARFQAWVETVAALTQGPTPREVVAIDGKTLRRSHHRATGQHPLHLVSAWASAQQLTLGQVKTADHSNELTAIPELLEMLDLAGAIVTIDAMGCQTALTTQVRAAGADYVLAVKGNQPWLAERITTHFTDAEARQWHERPHETVTTVEKDHGRIETRRVTVVPATDALADRAGWTDLTSVVRVEAERRAAVDGTLLSAETRDFISSLPPRARPLARAIRAHWGIENRCHWTLDVAFHEDQSRIRADHAPENLALIRRWALSLLKRETTHKRGIAAKRRLAGWDEAYFHHLLTLLTTPTTTT